MNLLLDLLPIELLREIYEMDSTKYENWNSVINSDGRLEKVKAIHECFEEEIEGVRMFPRSGASFKVKRIEESWVETMMVLNEDEFSENVRDNVEEALWYFRSDYIVIFVRDDLKDIVTETIIKKIQQLEDEATEVLKALIDFDRMVEDFRELVVNNEESLGGYDNVQKVNDYYVLYN